MVKILDIGGNLFFRIVELICLATIYFYVFPASSIMINIGFIFAIAFYSIFIYYGYKSKMGFKKGLLIGAVGSLVAFTFGFFALYLYLVSEQPATAIWLMGPWIIPTTSITKILPNNINDFYPIISTSIAILLTGIGSWIGKIKYKNT
jgi:hypothetical protein